MKYYKFPIMFLVDDGSGQIVTDGSETSAPGDIFDMYTFDPEIDEEDLLMIELNCDSFDLAGMDFDGDLYISLDEFEDWLADNPW